MVPSCARRLSRECESPKGGSDEADISAESCSSPARTRVSASDEDPGGPSDPAATSRQGTPATYDGGAVEVAVGIQTGPFERADRLVRPEEFAYVLQHGRRLRMGAFLLVVAERVNEGGGARTRLGITVSRRVGRAVVRNRLKRRIREWFRHERARIQGNLDIVVVARQAAAGLSGCEVARALRAGAQAAGVLV